MFAPISSASVVRNDYQRREEVGWLSRDRIDAGERLASLLQHFALCDPVIFGIPRGGVPVAAAVARLIEAPLEVLVARKIGAPHNVELGIGAISEGMDEPL